VIGPAADGGYWLIGLRAAQPSLFDNIPWSTDQVREITLHRIRAANLSCELLRELTDIDTESDWQHFVQNLL
jgi:uncharacterized protein